MLLTADDAAGLRLHEVLLGQATRSMLGGTVVHLGLGANGRHGPAIHHAVLTRCVVLASIGHFVFCLIPRKVE